ncbi:MAG: tRNA pseudouridine(55) synthase TruB [Bacteroidales bacterium]|nr:tRNA pseudouridine(55) synthase TruB [Bacteroidales bacterium]
MSPNREYHFEEGELLLIDKPSGWTSFDVVSKIRNSISRMTGRKIKVGHTGTLDPMATGLLLVCTGRMTKSISGLMNLDKEYSGTMRLDATTPSFDAETPVDREYSTHHITLSLLREISGRFTGRIMQVPPLYSAINVHGTRAYHLARRQVDADLPPRQVEIYSFDITAMDLPFCQFNIRCGKGTYIRALARDFGRFVGAGAFLTSLRRLSIGQYSVADAWSLDPSTSDFIPSDVRKCEKT